MPRYFECNILYTSENYEGASGSCLSFFSKVSLLFSSKKLAMSLRIFIQKAQWIELKRNCMALSYCSQTCAYPENEFDLPAGSTSKQNWEKPFYSHWMIQE